MRQEPGRIEAEVVITHAPGDRRGGRAVEHERFDAVPMIELPCDGQTRGPGSDDKGIGVVPKSGREVRPWHACVTTHEGVEFTAQ
ncbi:hypothetical protein MTY59_06560 [Mycobacterium senriense]|uniref:Uncharacterized protein n=1 Tax=Mycobacterium senriense TaxID=2775496 RepID=A0ABM7SSQ2_9MYCO|nr:hypothetical protein MTY59_06560 [Mycobacterium senriense]